MLPDYFRTVALFLLQLDILSVPAVRLTRKRGIKRRFAHLTDGGVGGWAGQVLLSWKRVAAGPHRYGSETVWPEKSHAAVMTVGPLGHFHCVPLSYWRGWSWERMWEEGVSLRQNKEKWQVETKESSRKKRGKCVDFKRKREARE